MMDDKVDGLGRLDEGEDEEMEERKRCDRRKPYKLNASG